MQHGFGVPVLELFLLVCVHLTQKRHLVHGSAGQDAWSILLQFMGHGSSGVCFASMHAVNPTDASAAVWAKFNSNSGYLFPGWAVSILPQDLQLFWLTQSHYLLDLGSHLVKDPKLHSTALLLSLWPLSWMCAFGYVGLWEWSSGFQGHLLPHWVGSCVIVNITLFSHKMRCVAYWQCGFRQEWFNLSWALVSSLGKVGVRLLQRFVLRTTGDLLHSSTAPLWRLMQVAIPVYSLRDTWPQRSRPRSATD